MKTPPTPPPQFGRGSVLAFILVVAAGYASLLPMLSDIEQWQLVTIVVLGVVYVAAGLGGDEWCDRVFGRAGKLVYFAFQILMGGAIVVLGRSGLIALILLPLASQAAAALHPAWMAAVCTAIVGVMVLPIALSVGLATAVPAAMSFGAGVVFVVVFTQVAVSEQRLRAESERLASELGEANRQLRDYAVQVEELAVARERNRMAREIHDSLGHYLTAVNMQLEAARAVCESDPVKAQEAVSKAQALTREGLADVRLSVASLRAAPGEDCPLLQALEGLVRESELAGVPASLEVLGTPRTLSPAADLTLYRAAQEGLTNIRKHAGRVQARLSLDFAVAGRVVLTVADNGPGAAPDGAGFGLLGVRERVQLLGGQVTAESRPGQGFVLTVTVPG